MKIKTTMFLFCLGFSLGSNALAFLADPAGTSQPVLRAILDDLEQKMLKIGSMQSRFIQKKKLSLFQHEIELHGSIAMKKPDRFAWRTESPVRYSIIIEKDKISQWNEDTNRVEVMSFSNVPALKIVIEQMRTWFYGAYGALLDQYDISLVTSEPLALKFVPREKTPGYGLIQSVTIQFRQDRSYIESILVEEKNGDLSALNFTDTVLNSKIDSAVWKAKNA